MAALGYERFVAQGGDWGSLVTCWLGYDHPDAVRAIHLNMVIMRPDMARLERPLDESERAWIEAMRRTVDLEGGYLRIQATKPQSLAVGLSDSPAGLAAWILGEILRLADAGSHLDRDLVLGNIALYWFTNTLASSAWMYATVLDRKHFMLPAGERIPCRRAWRISPTTPIRWRPGAGSSALPRSCAGRTCRAAATSPPWKSLRCSPRTCWPSWTSSKAEAGQRLPQPAAANATSRKA